MNEIEETPGRYRPMNKRKKQAIPVAEELKRDASTLQYVSPEARRLLTQLATRLPVVKKMWWRFR